MGPVPGVAIIGAALRFPGASDPSSFHELTVAGRRMFRSLAHPPDSPLPSGTAKRDDQFADRRSLLAALLNEETDDAFDAGGARADGVTARHVLAAETAAAALADIPPIGRAVTPERIGVLIAEVPEPGTTDVREWVHRRLTMLTPDDPVSARSHRRDVLSGDAAVLRPVGAGLQELLLSAIGAVRPGHGGGYGSAGRAGGVNGTAVVNRPAPESLHCSLRAVAEACEALNAGEFDLVLAGGVAKGLGAWTLGYPSSGDAAEDVRIYDASPTGSLPGEGCGIAALVRAADARALEVPAYAEIAGWHYASHAVSQRAVLSQAYLRADVDPADIQFVEGHGAATAAEDLAELTALVTLLGPRPGSTASRCALGSVAANIGDTRAAAGIAALLKTAFAMTADVIPPSTGCVHPNRLLSRDAAPFRLPFAAEQWPQTPVQFAAVNTLGAAPSPDAPRSGPVHLVLRRERDSAHRPGRRRKPAPLPANALPA